MKRTVFTFFVSLFLILGFSACDSGGSDDDNPGPGANSFSAEVGGDLTLVLNGTAGFGAAQNLENGAEGFALGMTTTAGSGVGAVITLGIVDGGRPDEGTYSIANYANATGAQDLVGQVIGTFQFNGETYLSSGGTMRITDSSSNNLKGEFNMTAQTFTGEGLPPAQTITIEGAFDAFGVDLAGQQGW